MMMTMMIKAGIVIANPAAAAWIDIYRIKQFLLTPNMDAVWSQREIERIPYRLLESKLSRQQEQSVVVDC